MKMQKQINKQMKITANNQNGACITLNSIETTSAKNDRIAAEIAAMIRTPKAFIRTSFVFVVINKKVCRQLDSNGKE